MNACRAGTKALPEVASLLALAMQDASIRKQPGHHKEPDVDVVCSFETRPMLASPQSDVPVRFFGLSSEQSSWWPMQRVRTPGRAAMDA